MKKRLLGRIFNRCIRPLWMVKCSLLVTILLTFLIHYSLRINNSKSKSKPTIKYELLPSRPSIPLPQCNLINQGENLEYQVEIDGQIYPQVNAQYLNKSINFTCLNSSNRIKRILAWNKFVGEFSYGMGLGKITPFQKRGCPVTKCEFTSDRNLIDSADLVLVHMRDNFDPIPQTPRPKDQRWMLLLYESPMNTPDFSEYNGVFNLTSTYRLDSDFSCNRDVFEWADPAKSDRDKQFKVPENKVEKIGISVAVISNCGASTRRMEYIREMRKYTRVDVFGKCGDKPFPTKLNRTGEKAKWRDIIADEYWFYLAFENSLCRDYVTEKFFMFFQYYIIPVTFGAGPYDVLVPKSGYIDAFDFEGPKQLAQYLNYLVANKTAYNSYFSWRKHAIYRHTSNNIPFCEMCLKLHLEDHFGIEPKVVDNIGDIWNPLLTCYKIEHIKIDSYDFRELKPNLENLA